jgi:hypothetical protein
VLLFTPRDLARVAWSQPIAFGGSGFACGHDSVNLQDTRLMQQRHVNIAGSSQTQKYSASCSLPHV